MAQIALVSYVVLGPMATMGLCQNNVEALLILCVLWR
jgi:hypothetical protein